MKLLGEKQKALADYTRAIEIDGTEAVAFVNRGIIFNELGQPKRALLDYTRAI